jgi:AcrR family transcriptional regulator
MSSSSVVHAHPALQERSLRNLERILSAAETVLSRDGWQSFTMKAVAEEAEASVGGLYRRFASKEQLLRAIKDNVLTRADAMHEGIAAHRAKDLSDALSHYARARIDALVTYADILRKILDAQPRADEVMETRGRQSVQLGFRTFRAVVAPFQAEITHPDRELAVEFAFYAFNAAVLRKMHAYPSESVFEQLDWEAMKSEGTTLLVRYLRG